MDSSDVAIVSAISGMIGAALVKILEFFSNRSDKQHDRDRQNRIDALAESKVLLDRQDARIASLEERSNACEERESRMQVANERLRGRIEMLEQALEREKIPFKKWVEPGSGPHTPLPPQG